MVKLLERFSVLVLQLVFYYNLIGHDLNLLRPAKEYEIKPLSGSLYLSGKVVVNSEEPII